MSHSVVRTDSGPVDDRDSHGGAAATAIQEPFDFTPYMSTMGGLLGVANVIMQLSIPPVGYGVIESRVESGQAMRHPIKRGRTTFTYLSVALIGTDEDKEAYRAAVNGVHRQVRSEDGSGAKYNAFDRSLQLWVAACLYAGMRDIALWLYPDLDGAAQDELYHACAALGTTLQVRQSDWPKDRAAFAAYWDGVVRDQVRIEEPVRAYLLELMALKNLPLPLRLLLGRFSTFITTGWLPPEFREAMRLDWTPQDQRRFDRINRSLRAVDLTLPNWARTFPWKMWLVDLRLRRRLGMKLV